MSASIIPFSRLYLRGLVDPATGRLDRVKIRAQARALAALPFSRWPTFALALRPVLREAKVEASTVRAILTGRDEEAADRDVREADAQALAKAYRYDAEALRFQVERRGHGSFTTTLDGSQKEQDRFIRAWTIARERKSGGTEPTPHQKLIRAYRDKRATLKSPRDRAVFTALIKKAERGEDDPTLPLAVMLEERQR